jgi:transcription antitermination factor NusG
MVTWVDGDSLDYFALKCTPGKERMVGEILCNRHILARTPMQKYVYAGRHVKHPVERERPLLAGLVFVAFPKEFQIPWFAIKKLHVVLGVIGMNHQPAKLDHAGLMRLFEDLVFSDVEVAAHKRVYCKGDRVKVIGGALTGFEAEVVSASDDELRLLCSVFGRETPVRLGANQLDMIEPIAAVAA